MGAGVLQGKVVFWDPRVVYVGRKVVLNVEVDSSACVVVVVEEVK